ncbi:hypothetical protein [Chondrinema litorale]|uniref:hypothetical protein n=1 Tax=Chondrinema litorale TaxID=2994555 RepID=UPI002542F34F|nr:hypothetical protein [Chondrinema litorale]UZR95958.1 hypothetical protein OQ292_09045 [Chondrinema litorale]
MWKNFPRSGSNVLLCQKDLPKRLTEITYRKYFQKDFQKVREVGGKNEQTAKFSNKMKGQNLMNGAEKERKYRCIAKVTSEKFVKYNTSNLLDFTDFLDEKFPGWRWFNVYSKNTRKQLGSFTKKRRPDQKNI